MGLLINPENHAELSSASDEYDPHWKACLEAHTSLNQWLDQQLGDGDWGGRYMTWLKSEGIQGQTDNGWWSKEAVTPLVLNAFVAQVKQ